MEMRGICGMHQWGVFFNSQALCNNAEAQLIVKETGGNWTIQMSVDQIGCIRSVNDISNANITKHNKLYLEAFIQQNNQTQLDLTPIININPDNIIWNNWHMSVQYAFSTPTGGNLCILLFLLLLLGGLQTRKVNSKVLPVAGNGSLKVSTFE